MSRQWTGGSAAVAGGTSGIGFAIAAALGGRGATVTIGGRDEARGRAAAAELQRRGIDAAFAPCDVRSAGSVRPFIDGAARRGGGLDIVVNSAGVEGPIAALHEYPDESLDDVLRTNFAGVALGMKYALPHLLQRGGGAIINLASTIGTVVPFAGGVVYGGTKAAVTSMTAAVAAGYAEHGIRAWALQPWITDTPMVDRLSGGSAEGKAQLASMNPSGRILAPDDVARHVISLLDGDSASAGSPLLVIDAA